MRKTGRKYLIFLAALLLMLLCAAAAAESGSCGPNLTWTLDESGVLTISGTGGMKSMDASPWKKVRQAIIQPGVTSIGDRAFDQCKELASVTIPESVTKIGGSAFHGCTSLTGITIPSGVTAIGEHAFSGCVNLQNPTLPGSLKSLGARAFSGCTGLTAMTIPGGVGDSVGYSVFLGCSKLQSVVIAEGVKKISGSMFTDCVSLQSVSISASVKTIGEYAFNRCAALSAVNLPAGMTKIETGTFVGCAGLKSIVIPRGVKAILGSAFYNCSGLTSVSVPSSVKNIGDYAFYGCTALGSVSIPACNTDGIAWFQNNGYSGALQIGPHEEIVTDPAVPATCDQTGLTAGSHCALCGQGITAQEAVPALGHLWGNVRVTWSADYSTATAARTCGRDASHTETETMQTTSEITLQPTANRRGETTYTAVFANPAFGTQTRTVRNIPRLEPISLKKCAVSVMEDRVYTGKAQKPVPTVTWQGKKLKKDQDFTISWANNKAVGTAKVTLEGKGNYTGSVSRTFRILPKAVKITEAEARTGEMILRWSRGTGITGYELSYSLRSSFRDATTISISKASTLKTSIPGLKAGKGYYFRIRAWKNVGGKKYYSEWSKTVKKKAK